MRQVEEHPSATPELVERLYGCIKGYCNGGTETNVVLSDLYSTARIHPSVGRYCFIRLFAQKRIDATWYEHGVDELVKIELL